MKIFLPIIVGGLTSVGSIIVHACALRMVIYVVQHERLRGRAGVHFWLDVAIVAAATLISLVAHLAEIALWALVFVGCENFRTSPLRSTTPRKTTRRSVTATW